MVCEPRQHCFRGAFKPPSNSLNILARRLLLDFPWADCLRPLHLSLHVAGDIRLWAKTKIDALEKFPAKAPTYWAAMTIAASYAKLAYYSKPLTAAEAIQKKLVPKEVPKCPLPSPSSLPYGDMALKTALQ